MGNNVYMLITNFLSDIFSEKKNTNNEILVIIQMGNLRDEK